MMAAEFIATWGALVEQADGAVEEDSTETEPNESIEVTEPVTSDENAKTIRETIDEVCPDVSERLRLVSPIPILTLPFMKEMGGAARTRMLRASDASPASPGIPKQIWE